MNLTLVKSGTYSDKTNHFMFRGTPEELSALAKEHRALYDNDQWSDKYDALEKESNFEAYNPTTLFIWWLRKHHTDRIVEIVSWHTQDGGL